MIPPNPNPYLHPAEAIQRQRALILRVVRAMFFILLVTFTMLTVLRTGAEEPIISVRWYIPVTGALVLFGAAIAVDLVTPNKKISTIISVLVGVLAGMLASLAIGLVIDLMLQSWVEKKEAIEAVRPIVTFIKVLIGITFSYLGVTTVLQTQDDFRLVLPYVEFAKQIRGTRPMLLDTSALIDGRIADVAGTGFLQAPVVVPRFVIAELQMLADSGEPMKRAKGRRGLEIISKIQRLPRLDVTIDETPVPGKAVDTMLVELAREMPAVVVTTDVALARVAAIHGVPVLNLNDLANAVKMALVPGEPVTVRLMRQGEQAGQAVGYLSDGTMVVAEDGGSQIGQTVSMVVTSSLQTSAGRLIFARIGAAGEEGQAPTPPVAIQAAESTPALPEVPKVEPVPDGPETEANGPRSPFPPKQRPIRAGTPRNPRR